MNNGKFMNAASALGWFGAYLLISIVAINLPDSLDTAVTVLALWGLVLICARKLEGKKTISEMLSHGGIRGVRPAVIALAFCAGAGLNLALGGLLPLLPIPEDLIESYANASSQYEDPTNALMFKTVFLVPILEETVFRGLIGDRIGKALPKWLAVPLAAGFFAVMHGNLLWCTYAFLSGLILMLLYFRCNSILPCIAFHLAFNASNYLWVKILPFPEEIWAYAVSFALGAVICIGSLIPMLLIKQNKNS